MHPDFATTSRPVVEPPWERVLDEVAGERAVQDFKWGEQNHDNGTARRGSQEKASQAKELCQALAANGEVSWRHILNEEVQEAFAEAEPERLRAELIQVAAVAVAWVEAIDRRSGR